MNALPRTLNADLVGPEAETLELELRKRIVGQDAAIEPIVKAYQTHLASLNNPGRPVATFLFMGPTGSGKTRIVESLAEALVGNDRAVVKVDCAEFQHGHDIAKLIGSPPGYIGHRETHALLSQDNLDQYHTASCKLSFVLFDEVEKASPALWNLLLGILDKATLTLGDNRRVDFSRAMVFMTSNLGSAEMSALMEPGFGFVSETAPPDTRLWNKVSQTALASARRKFTPEFINRIDHMVVFRPLEEQHLRQILDLELGYVQDRINNAPNGQFAFECSVPVKDFLLHEGTDSKYGARHLKRAVERHLVSPLSNLIATGQVNAGEMLDVGLDEMRGRLVFTAQPLAVPAPVITASSRTLDEAATTAGMSVPAHEAATARKRAR